MSRGPGRIERVIVATFAADPSMTYAVDELAAIAYPGVNRVEKKHRVSVMRAAKNVAARTWWGWQWMGQSGHPVVYYNLLDYRSYVIGRMRAAHNYWNFGHAEISEAIDDPTIDRLGADYWREQSRPGSAYWTHVEINRAEHAGDHDRANALREELNASIGTQLARLSPRL